MEIPIVDGQAERPQEGDTAQQQHIDQGEMVAPIEGGVAELSQQDHSVQPEQTMHESELEAPAEDSTYHSPSPEAPLHESEMEAPLEDTDPAKIELSDSLGDANDSQPEAPLQESEMEAPAEGSTNPNPSPEAPLHESEMKAPIEDISNEPKSPDTPAAREILPDVQDSTQGDALITDKEEAVEAAYAAKPFEDAKIEKADKLSDDQQEVLSWLSSEAAESAVKSYRESKTQMTEAESAIREHFEPVRQIANSEESSWEKDKASFGSGTISEEERDKKYSTTEKLLQEIVDDQFETIMQNEESSDRDKLNGVQQLAKIRTALRAELALNQGENPFPGSPSELMHRYEAQPEMLIPVLWGKFIASAVQDRGFFSIDALEQISKLTGQPFETLFDKLHDTFVEANASSANKSGTDQALDRQGYLWSPSRNRYVKISE